MFDRLDPTDRRLLDEFQRDLPLVPRPFAAMGQALGLTESEVLDRLCRLVAAGRVTRVGATCRPNTAGASTLAALAIPERDRFVFFAAERREAIAARDRLRAQGLGRGEFYASAYWVAGE